MSLDPFAQGSPKVITNPGDCIDCDIAIVGSGVGGATLAWALRDTGVRVLVIEKGDFLPREWQNWSPWAVHMCARYRNSDPWIDPTGQAFVPGSYHYVGGSSKFWGATMPRLRETDFGEVVTRDGVSPAWPIDYADLEPFYAQAEELYWVHGDESDRTGPWRSGPYPYPPVPHEGPIDRIAERLSEQGLHPYSLPQAVDSREGGRCILCGTCDSYVCLLDARGDADVSAMRPALESANVRLLTNANAHTVEVADDGSRITCVELGHGSRRLRVTASRFVIAAGAVNTAALLLRSRSKSFPEGVANSSGMVGRNYMAHLSTFVVAVRPGRHPHLTYEKTLGFNDWYHAGPTNEFPLGNVQGLGKLYGATIKPERKAAPLGVLDWMTNRSVEMYPLTEDLPVPDSRVTVDARGRIHLTWRRTNLASHHELVHRTEQALRKCGYPLIFSQMLALKAASHQCGTARMGVDPSASVVDRNCRAHDVENMWIVDASVFPSSAAVNPALTVAANALRVAAHGSLSS